MSEASPRMIVKRLNWTSTSGPTSACSDEEDQRLPTVTAPEGSGRFLFAPHALEVAVDQVVVGAAGAAHGDRSDQEEQEVPDVRARPRS